MNYKEFIDKYRHDHYFCPSCHTHNYTSTLVGYLYDENHPEDYKDKNIITCNICGWEGIRHDLIPKSEKTGFKICYWDQINRCHIYNDNIYESKEEAKVACQELNNKYQKYVHIEFYPYEIEIKD